MSAVETAVEKVSRLDEAHARQLLAWLESHAAPGSMTDGVGGGQAVRLMDRRAGTGSGCGSLFLSHLNDGGFWIVKECLGLSVSQTLRTWTVTETIVGIAGLLLTLAVHSVWQVFHH